MHVQFVVSILSLKPKGQLFALRNAHGLDFETVSRTKHTRKSKTESILECVNDAVIGLQVLGVMPCIVQVIARKQVLPILVVLQSTNQGVENI